MYPLGPWWKFWILKILAKVGGSTNFEKLRMSSKQTFEYTDQNLVYKHKFFYCDKKWMPLIKTNFSTVLTLCQSNSIITLLLFIVQQKVKRWKKIKGQKNCKKKILSKCHSVIQIIIFPVFPHSIQLPAHLVSFLQKGILLHKLDSTYQPYGLKFLNVEQNLIELGKNKKLLAWNITHLKKWMEKCKIWSNRWDFNIGFLLACTSDSCGKNDGT